MAALVKSVLFIDFLRLSVIGVVALLAGIVLNLVRPKPLPLQYQSPAARLVTDSSAQGIAAQLISFEETRAALEHPDVVIVDARPTVFFQAGHLPGAINLPHDQFTEYFPKVQELLRRPGLAGVIIYCSGGDCVDSARVAQQLAAAGIGPLAIYEGGWEEWASRETLQEAR